MNKAIAILIMASVTVAVLESEPLLHDGRESLFHGLELVFGGIFLVEYLARLWTAPEGMPHASPWSARLRHALSPASLLDLAALLPLLLMFTGPEAFVLRFARMLRILRFSRMGRFSGAMNLLIRTVAERRHEMFAGLCVSFALLVAAATLLYVVEGESQPEAFGSIPRSMWWAIATLTTVGYGDVAPITALGRICAGAVAVIGIGLIAIPTGILAAAFSDAMQARRAAKTAARKEGPPR